MTEVRITRSRVIETKAFKELGFIQRKVMSSRNQICRILNAVAVVNNIGYDKWEGQSNANWNTKEIVKELVNN